MGAMFKAGLHSHSRAEPGFQSCWDAGTDKIREAGQASTLGRFASQGRKSCTGKRGGRETSQDASS